MGLYFFLVLDHADDIVLGRRGLAMSNPQSMRVGAAWGLQAHQVVVGRDVVETHPRCNASAFEPCVTLGTVDNLITKTHESVGEIHNSILQCSPIV